MVFFRVKVGGDAHSVELIIAAWLRRDVTCDVKEMTGDKEGQHAQLSWSWLKVEHYSIATNCAYPPQRPKTHV